MHRRRFGRERGGIRVAPGRRRRGRLALLTAFTALLVVTLVAGGGATSAVAGRDVMSAWSSPAAITAGPDGNLWFSEYDGNRIGRMTQTGVFTEFAPDPAAEGDMGSGPLSLAAGPDGNLWFTDTERDRIGRMTTRGETSWFSRGISQGAGPGGIAAGSDGNLWFTEARSGGVGRITPAGRVTEFRTGIGAASAPSFITAGPDGNLWFTDSARSRIGRITTGGSVTWFRRGITAAPLGIAAGPDGNLWFTQPDGDRVGRITPAGAVTEFSAGIVPGGQPFGITAGPDGNLWFTEWEGNRIGRITPAGVVTEFSAGISPGPGGSVHWGSGSYPFGITAGPDGNLWFTEYVGDRIGRITPQGVISEFPPTAAIGRVRLRGTRAVGVRLRCPPGAASPCRGVVRLRPAYTQHVEAAARFSVAPGRRTEMILPLWAAGRRQLQTKGALRIELQLLPGAHTPRRSGACAGGCAVGGSYTRQARLVWRRAPAVTG